jgi:hypothetical protein
MSARSHIGGALDQAALARLYFASLEPAEQAAAVRRLAATGQSVWTISHATGLSPEAIHQVLTEREASRA